MRYFFVINPDAGKGRALQFKSKINEYFKIRKESYSVFISSGIGTAFSAVREEVAKGGDIRVYACGGDGTLFETVGGAYGYHNAEIGCIPFGWGNNFIRNFGTLDDFKNLNGQINGSSVPIDLIKCGDKYAVNFCSVGMGSELKDNFLNQFSGRLNYNVPMLKDIAIKRNNKWNITADGQKIDGSFLLVAAANGRYYGCGYKICSDSYPGDGYFSCILIRSASLLKTLSMISAYKNGELYLDLSSCTVKNVKSLKIETEVPVHVAIDGETFEIANPEFCIEERATRFIVPSVAIIKDHDEKKAGILKNGNNVPIFTNKM